MTTLPVVSPVVSLEIERPAPAEPVVPISVIQSQSGWTGINVSELWAHRELLYFLALRDVKVRYKQTALGAAWAILQPTAMMIVFTIFFRNLGRVPAGDSPYPVFVYAGLLPWLFFTTAVANASDSVVKSEQLITKVYFPRLAIPFAAAGAALVDLCIACSLLGVLMAWYGVPPGSQIVYLPLLVALLVLAAIGVGTLISALNVAYRDFRYVVPFMLQLWMLATPAIYMQASPQQATGWISWIWLANPLTGIISGFRSCVLGQPLDVGAVALSGAIVVSMFVAGCLYFRRVEDDFADMI